MSTIGRDSNPPTRSNTSGKLLTIKDIEDGDDDDDDNGDDSDKEDTEWAHPDLPNIPKSTTPSIASSTIQPTRPIKKWEHPDLPNISKITPSTANRTFPAATRPIDRRHSEQPRHAHVDDEFENCTRRRKRVMFQSIPDLKKFPNLDKISDTDVLDCRRFFYRRNALCDPEKMIIKQESRERFEKDIEKRKTQLSKKLGQFCVVKLGKNGEEHLA